LMNQSLSSTNTQTLPSVEDLPERRRKALVQVLGAITYGELKAYDGAMAQAKESSTEAQRKAYRKIAAEELRHHKGFSRRLVALGADVERAMKPYMSSLDAYHAGEAGDEISEAVAGYLGEGIAADMLRWLQKVTDAETAAFIETVIADEVEHEKLATERLVAMLDSTPDGHLRAEAGVRRMILRMLGAGTSRGASSAQRYRAFLELGRPVELATAIIGGMARRVSALGISPIAPLLPLRLPDPLGLLRPGGRAHAA